MKKENKSWQEQLDQIIEDGGCGDPKCTACNNFGWREDNDGWTKAELKKFIGKLEGFGAANISIPDNSTIQLDLPGLRSLGRSQILMTILTAKHLPTSVKETKTYPRITLHWDW